MSKKKPKKKARQKRKEKNSIAQRLGGPLATTGKSWEEQNSTALMVRRDLASISSHYRESKNNYSLRKARGKPSSGGGLREASLPRH